MGKDRTDEPLPQPHKRPSQARAKFTVDSLYEGFVRIWRRDGPEAATTRAIAEESGYAVGTLYEYFPNRTALLSGYVRHCMEQLCSDLAAANTALAGEPWETRLRKLVSLTLDEDGQAPYFDREMLERENQIASDVRHRQIFQHLARTWSHCIAQWEDFPGPVDDTVIDILLLTLWGGRRYSFLVDAGTPDQRGELSTRMARALLLPEE